jgi:hypothetical protein
MVKTLLKMLGYQSNRPRAWLPMAANQGVVKLEHDVEQQITRSR